MPSAGELLALAMLATLAVSLFSGLPVAVVLIGIGFLFGGLGMLLGIIRPAEFGAIFFRVYGALTDSDEILYASVPLLVFMGATLQRAGLAQDLLLGVQGLFRRLRGGPLVAVMVLGAVLAPTAGVIAASVSAIALMALPVLLRQGYRPADAAGAVAAAGTLGVVVPPGIMLFFVADAIGVQVPAMFLGMLGPLALVLGAYVVFVALARAPDRAAAAVDDRPFAPTPLVRLVAPCLLIAAVLAAIAFGWASLSESAALGAAGALLAAVAQRRFSAADLGEVIRQTTLTTAMVFLIFLGASVFSLVFRLLGGAGLIAGALRSLELGSLGVLVVILAAVFVLGFFFDWVEIVLVAFPILKPVLEGLDFGGHLGGAHLALYWAAVLLALNLQTSFLTPPFGYALLLAKGVAPPGVTLGDIYRGVVPYILIQVVVIAAVVAFPAIATWLPDRAFDLSLPQGGKFKE
ncbi:MAG TPA: TRAP transporter large permease subunit [Burkholderiales bacterium]|nr:TRAP transporter large permease subunit [Burkholderiales bacterium]